MANKKRRSKEKKKGALLLPINALILIIIILSLIYSTTCNYLIPSFIQIGTPSINLGRSVVAIFNNTTVTPVLLSSVVL